ncbi:hypothetical protein HW555_002089 [Spodoptera exigua]|uniref:MADF domain-containing protein n=1 Tax=Spodoptera exigua TaxID=7107 RepID=A0A835L7A5_SPOEX|nr:hypothetical protein HW555_002089 [Spodoptera exigua]
MKLAMKKVDKKNRNVTAGRKSVAKRKRLRSITETSSESDTIFLSDESDCETFDEYLSTYLEQIENKENFEPENFSDISYYTSDVMIKQEDWVIVKFTTKKSVKHFVGRVISMKDSIPTVKFVRKVKNTKDDKVIFTYPNVEDVSEFDLCIGVWKRRFPVLFLKSRLNLMNMQAVIIVTAVLHNIARNMNLEEVEPEISVPDYLFLISTSTTNTITIIGNWIKRIVPLPPTPAHQGDGNAARAERVCPPVVARQVVDITVTLPSSSTPNTKNTSNDDSQIQEIRENSVHSQKKRQEMQLKQPFEKSSSFEELVPILFQHHYETLYKNCAVFIHGFELFLRVPYVRRPRGTTRRGEGERTRAAPERACMLPGRSCAVQHRKLFKMEVQRNETCAICDRILNSDVVVTVKERGLSKFVESSLKRNDGKEECFKNRVEIQLHKTCRNSYNNPKCIEAVKRRREKALDNESVAAASSSADEFDFENKCIFCDTDASLTFERDQNKIPTSSRILVGQVKKVETQSTILQACTAHDDDWSQQVLLRIDQVNILEKKARYHYKCYSKFCHSYRAAGLKRGRQQSLDSVSGMDQVYQFIEGDQNDCQYSLPDIREALKNVTLPSDAMIKYHLKQRYGDKMDLRNQEEQISRWLEAESENQEEELSDNSASETEDILETEGHENTSSDSCSLQSSESDSDINVQPIVWSSEQILTLIELYQNSQILWDTSHNVEGKIHNIRSQFLRERKKIASSKSTGSASGDVHKSNWFAYDSLLFLVKGATSSGSMNSMNAQTSESTVAHEQIPAASQVLTQPPEAPTSPPPLPTQQMPLTNTQNKRKKDDLSEVYEIMKSAKARMDQQKDEYQIYADYIA